MALSIIKYALSRSRQRQNEGIVAHVAENGDTRARDLRATGKLEIPGRASSIAIRPGRQLRLSVACVLRLHGDGKVDAADSTNLDHDGQRDAGEGALDVLRIWRDANGDTSNRSR